jgi:hypothetical protein
VWPVCCPGEVLYRFVAAKSKGKKILFCFAHFLREKREKKSFEKLTGHFGNETGPPTADRRPPTADPILIPSPGRVRHSAAGGGGARENSQKLIEL